MNLLAFLRGHDTDSSEYLERMKYIVQRRLETSRHVDLSFLEEFNSEFVQGYLQKNGYIATFFLARIENPLIRWLFESPRVYHLNVQRR